MRQVVRDVFFDFTAAREGFTPFPYCDTLNLVTTGVGNLIDAGPRNGFDISDAAMAPAMRLPWKIRAAGWTSKNPLAGALATPDEVREGWIRCKLQEQNVPGFNQRGGFAYANLTPLTLDMDGLKQLFQSTENHFDEVLSSRYPNYEQWPADAQLATMSMAWAMGPAFNFPAFKAATDRLDFATAAEQSFFKGGGGTLTADPNTRAGRNKDNYLMFQNADAVVKGGTDRDRLYFPGTPANSAGQLPSSGQGNASLSTGGPGGIANVSGSNPRIGDAAVISVGLGAAGWAGYQLFKHFRGKR